MKILLSLLIAGTMAFITTPGHAAVSVILECPGAGEEHEHPVFEIDYDARTVREHFVDDDGGPATAGGQYLSDGTYSARISDNEISWENDVGWRMILGRYSETLTVNHGGYSGNFPCHPYAPNRQKKF